MGIRHGEDGDRFFNVMVRLKQRSDPERNVIHDGRTKIHVPMLEITSNGVYLYNDSLREAEFIPTSSLVRLQIEQRGD